MTTLELLRQQDRELASIIENANIDQLRSISSAVAQFVVKRSTLSHPLITEAFQHLSTAPYSNLELRDSVRKLGERLDEKYFELQELCEDGKATEAQVSAAFAKARAATAVASALGDVALTAAVETAYEAFAASDDSPSLIKVARSAMS